MNAEISTVLHYLSCGLLVMSKYENCNDLHTALKSWRLTDCVEMMKGIVLVCNVVTSHPGQ